MAVQPIRSIATASFRYPGFQSLDDETFRAQGGQNSPNTPSTTGASTGGGSGGEPSIRSAVMRPMTSNESDPQAPGPAGPGFGEQFAGTRGLDRTLQAVGALGIPGISMAASAARTGIGLNNAFADRKAREQVTGVQEPVSSTLAAYANPFSDVGQAGFTEATLSAMDNDAQMSNSTTVADPSGVAGWGAQAAARSQSDMSDMADNPQDLGTGGGAGADGPGTPGGYSGGGSYAEASQSQGRGGAAPSDPSAGDRGSPSGGGDDGSSGGGGCFLTTACCEAMGMTDDCDDLETLRAYRDRVMLATPEGRRDVEQYYRLAPGIVSAIRNPDVWRSLHAEFIRPAVAAIKDGRNRRAHRIYRKMVARAVALVTTS